MLCRSHDPILVTFVAIFYGKAFYLLFFVFVSFVSFEFIFEFDFEFEFNFEFNFGFELDFKIEFDLEFDFEFEILNVVKNPKCCYKS